MTKQKASISMVNACVEANAQRKKFEDQDYQVVPVIALVEGVHIGSAGAAYYPGDEISKFVEAWNGVPLPVYHPMDSDGDYVSCNSPDTIEKQSVGYFFYAHYENGKLKGELWINIEKAKRIDPVVLEILNSGRLLEVSTSFFSDQDYVNGEWGGEKYEVVIRNIRPDHLALLPGGQGACSVADGCGAPRVNQEGGDKMPVDEGKIKKLISQLGQLIGLKVQENSNDPDGDDKTTNNTKGGERNMDKVKEMATALIANELTAFKDDDREFLEGLTEDQLKKLEPKVNEVKHPEEKDVTTLIALETSPFEAKDKEMLSGFTECQFNALVEKYPEKKEEPKVNADEKPLTAQEYIGKAPEAIQEVLTNAMKLQDEQKDTIIKGLLANKRNPFTEDQLKAKKIDELQSLAQLAQVDVDYSGNGGSVNTIVDNGEPLEAPTIEDMKVK